MIGLHARRKGRRRRDKKRWTLLSLSPFPLFRSPIPVPPPFRLPRGNGLAKTGHMNTLQQSVSRSPVIHFDLQRCLVEGFIRQAIGSYGWDQEPLGMIENGARNGNTCPPSPSRSPLFLAPIVHQISGIPKYEPTPIPRGYQLLLPIFLSRGQDRSEKNGVNAMKAETTSTLLPWLIGTKHIPEFKTLPRIQKHFPESKTHPSQKHFPESKKLPRIQKHFPESKTHSSQKHFPESKTRPRI